MRQRLPPNQRIVPCPASSPATRRGHGRPQRQRPALPRLRHPRHRRRLRVRGNRPPARPRHATERPSASRLQGEAALASRLAESGAVRARSAAGRCASDGRHAHGRLGARLRAAREGRPQRARRARHRRPADGLVRLDAALLVPLEPQRPAHRRRDRRRLGRRAFPAAAAGAPAAGAVGQGDAHVLNLYAEPSSTPPRSARVTLAPAGPYARSRAIGTARPKHGCATTAFDGETGYVRPQAEADCAPRRGAGDHRLRPPSLPIGTRATCHQGLAKRLSNASNNMKPFAPRARLETCGGTLRRFFRP